MAHSTREASASDDEYHECCDSIDLTKDQPCSSSSGIFTSSDEMLSVEHHTRGDRASSLPPEPPPPSAFLEQKPPVIEGDSNEHYELPPEFQDQECDEDEPGPSTNPDAEWIIDEEAIKQYEVTMTPDEMNFREARALVLKGQGNKSYRDDEIEDAARLYTKALWLCPLKNSFDRSILFANRAAAFIRLEKRDLALADCDKAIELRPEYVKALLRRASLLESGESTDWDKALQDYELILKYDPNNGFARAAVLRLRRDIHERNETMKAEMMDKLKDLGNMVLRPFGLSTDNFKLEPNEAGGYSVRMDK